MRLFLIIITGVLLVTYAWGWVLHVPDGQMDTPAYSEYYWQELKDQVQFVVKEAEMIIEISKNPLPRPKEMEF